MKRILLKDRGTFKAREVLIAMMETPAPNAGITYSQMRQRDRVLDALEAHKDKRYVDLEDADYQVVIGILEVFQWATAKRELRQVLDEIHNAKAPEDTTELKVVESGGG